MMNIHEYQAKELLRRNGIAVPAGRVAASPDEAGAAYQELGRGQAIIKAQIHAGARGKAGGVKRVGSRAEAEAAARNLLGRRLVTGQTGPNGLPVHKVLVEETLAIRSELYLSVSLDREAGAPVAVASAHGGVDIEELGRTDPTAIVSECGDPGAGIEPFQARKLFSRMGLSKDLMQPMTALIGQLGRVFVQNDCSLIEINPLALTEDGKLVAADLKMCFDDNGLARRPELAALRDPTQEDPREVEAKRYGLSYVGLAGSVGCMVNGAGLAMATMDLIRLSGAEPANFLDVGGAATAENVTAAFRILCQDERVKAVLVNIFGGIVRCDLIAEGILAAVKQVEFKVPLVVRLEGTKAAEGRQTFAESGLEIVSADSLGDAAAKAAAFVGS